MIVSSIPLRSSAKITDIDIHGLPIPISHCRVFCVFWTNDALGNSIGRCAFDHQLEVALFVKESKEVDAFVDSVAN
jgi:hypothetical protein